MNEIRTTNPQWIILLAKSYKEKSPIILLDDANIGINPINDTLLQMGLKSKIGTQDWIAVFISLGVAVAGAYLLVMAIVDPEPFSRIGLALATGAVLTMGGGFTAVRILTKVKPPKVKISGKGFEISWD